MPTTITYTSNEGLSTNVTVTETVDEVVETLNAAKDNGDSWVKFTERGGNDFAMRPGVVTGVKGS